MAPETSSSSPASEVTRLERVESHTVACLDIAVRTLEEASKLGEADQDALTGLCSKFLGHIRSAQDTLAASVGEFAVPGAFTPSVYATLGRAQTSSAKLDLVLDELRCLQVVLERVAEADAVGKGTKGAAQAS